MPGRIFADKYEVQEQIAQGAMGIVYKALDRKLNRVVALKVVHSHLTSDPSFLERFLREARAMARLQHEHIVSIFSVEQDQGTQFIVMEFFQGTNLFTRIQSSASFPLPEAITVTYQIAKALAYAHEHGIIHRDVKPANVLIGSDNRVKLTDFGIAAALDDAPLETAGQLIGTLLYMSPEQARDATLDGRSDLYSLGLILYEMLTGTHPRRDLSNTAILGMLSAEEESPVLTFPPSVSTETQAIVKDLLRYRPVDRIKDARQLLRRLESLQVIGNAGQEEPIPNKLPPNSLLSHARASTEPADRGLIRDSVKGNISAAYPSAPKLFFCYRREDSADIAGRIYDRLLNQFGEPSLFKDVDSIPYGVDFRTEIDKAISTCTAVLAIIGRRWLTSPGKPRKRAIDDHSDYVRIELASALKRQIPVIPVLVAGAAMPASDTLPDDIRDFSYRNAIRIKPDPDFRTDMDRLIKGILRLHDSR